MSRGPGRLQRAILFVLEHDQPEDKHRRRQWPSANDGVGAAHWTTEEVCSALSGTDPDALVAVFGPSPVAPIKVALRDRGEPGWWWDETFTRQVRRALDRMAAVGRVEKLLVTNRRYAAREPQPHWDYPDWTDYADQHSDWTRRVERHPQPTVAYWRAREVTQVGERPPSRHDPADQGLRSDHATHHP